jgi:hypothetical protein
VVDIALPKPAASRRSTAWLRHLRVARRWIPRSLLLAVLGIGLSSWLIPALTRQWDDRQKAGEIKAVLIADMATSTGRVLLDAQAFSDAPARSRPSTRERDASMKVWSVAVLDIRARLNAYFGSAATDAWAEVTRYVTGTLSRAYGGNVHDVYVRGRLEGPATGPGRLQDVYAQYYSGEIDLNEMAAQLLTQEDDFARAILSMNVRGYSTTWHDLLSDLLPKL